jgi:hypothetical protein
MNAYDFLRTMFPGLAEHEQINIRAFHARSGRKGYNDFASTPEQAAEMVRQIPNDMEVYFGVNPRTGRDGSKEGVTRVHLYHADVDWKWYGGDRQAALDALLSFELEPSLIVESGHGFHAYWFLEESLPPEQIALAESHMTRLYVALGGLDNVQDVSRILRVAGTFNNKDPRQRRDVTVVYHTDVTYTPDQFEAVLPELPRKVDHKVTTEVLADGDKPSLALLEELLSFIDPCVPYAQYIVIWGAVAYYYPDADGLALVDRWSSDKREAAGSYSSPRTQPEKHAGFRRQIGRVSTIGTLIHLAREGGYVPPAKAHNLIIKTPKGTVDKGGTILSAIRKKREGEWRSKLDDLPNPGYDDLPWMLQQLYDFLGDLTDPFPRDYTTMMALTFVSMCYPKIRFENLGLNLWVMAVVEQGSGKNDISDALCDVIERVKSITPELYTSGTPEGMYRKLKGDQKLMLCYLREFGDWLSTLAREHMKGARGVMCNLYDGATTAHQLSREEVKITRPYAVIVGTTTPRAVIDNVKKHDLEGGFASRFWYLANEYQNVSKKLRPTPQAVIEMADVLDEHVAAMTAITTARFDVPVGQVPQAYADYEIYCGVNTGEIRTFSDALDDPRMPKGRHLARVKKVAALLECCERRPMIDHDNCCIIVRQKNLELAIVLVKRAEIYQEIVVTNVSSTEEEKALNSIQRVIDKAGVVGLTRTQIMQQAHVKAGDIKALLPMLQEAGLVEESWETERPMYRSTDPAVAPPKVIKDGGNLKLLKAGD